MIVQFFTLLFIHSLQYLSLIPTKQTLVEVLHADGDLVTFTQFLKNDFPSSTLQNHGPVTILAPSNRTFESFFASPGDKNMIQEHLTQNIARTKLSATGIQTAYFESRTKMKELKRLIKYEVIGGSCYTRESEYGTLRFTTSVYSKQVNLYETNSDSQVDDIKVTSSESTGVIHVLEKPFLQGDASGLLNMTAEKILSESNISLLHDHDISHYLYDVIDANATPTATPTTNENATTIITNENATAVITSATDEINPDTGDALTQVQIEKSLGQRVKGLFGFSDKFNDYILVNQPLLNGTFEIESNDSVNITVSQQNTSTTLNGTMGQSVENLKDSDAISYFGSSETLDLPDYLRYTILIFRIVKSVVCVALHYKFILGLLTGLAVHPLILPWIKKQEERRKKEDDERLQKRKNWIETRIAASNN